MAKKKYNKYDLSGEYGIGFTSKGEQFYFDLEDYDLIRNYTWYVHHGYLEARDGDHFVRFHGVVFFSRGQYNEFLYDKIGDHYFCYSTKSYKMKGT